MTQAELLHRIDKDIVRGDDGGYVYWPDNNGGCYSAPLLRLIADELDAKNRLQRLALDTDTE